MSNKAAATYHPGITPPGVEWAPLFSSHSENNGDTLQAFQTLIMAVTAAKITCQHQPGLGYVIMSRVNGGEWLMPGGKWTVSEVIRHYWSDDKPLHEG